MPTRKKLEPNSKYHIYNRGAHKEAIFLNDNDYWRFLHLLYLSNNRSSLNQLLRLPKDHSINLFEIPRVECLVKIYAYCLMPNHFHILLEENVANGITKFMRKLCTSYSMYYNAKYKHSGTLIQGAFQSKIVLDDSYFLYLHEYIHLNPYELKVPGWKDIRTDRNVRDAYMFCKNYPYSSLADYCGTKRIQRAILGESLNRINLD